MFGLQVVTRMMFMTMVMVSGTLSVWKGYFWVNNLGYTKIWLSLLLIII
jgi:hypothetical protein